MDRTKATINQHLYFPHLRDVINAHIKVFITGQNNKKQDLKYVQLPAKEAESIP